MWGENRGEREGDGGVIVGGGLMRCRRAVTRSAQITDQPLLNRRTADLLRGWSWTDFDGRPCDVFT